MLYEKLDKLIASAMTQRESMNKSNNVAGKNDAEKSLNLWRGIKTEMVNALHNGLEIPNDENELKILKAMAKQRRAAANEFAKAIESGDVARMNYETNVYEADMIEQMLPKAPNPEDVKAETNCVIKTFVELKAIEDPGFNSKMLQRYTKDIISKVKEKYPQADNGIIAGCIKEYVNS